jgi:hypothetical protein
MCYDRFDTDPCANDADMMAPEPASLAEAVADVLRGAGCASPDVAEMRDGTARVYFAPGPCVFELFALAVDVLRRSFPVGLDVQRRALAVAWPDVMGDDVAMAAE